MASMTVSATCAPVISAQRQVLRRASGSSQAAGLGRVCLQTPSRKALSRRQRSCLTTRAADSTVEKVANDIGLPTEEGLFGFKPFPEVWVGRLAMMGFLTSMVEEGITGRGTLEQIGFLTPSQPLFLAIVCGATCITLAAAFNTILRAVGGKLSPKEAQRYRSFLGLKGEGKALRETQAELKSGWAAGAADFTAPDSISAIVKAQQEPKPIDSFLAMADRREAAQEAEAIKSQPSAFDVDNRAEADGAAQQLKAQPAQGPSLSLQAKADVEEQDAFQGQDFKYARSIEISQGRWAMLGFLAAIAVEAATGHGILGQVIDYLKLSGLLGAESGF